MLTQTAIRSGTHRQAGSQARNGAPTRSYEPNGSMASDVISLMGATMSFARNSEIYGESEPAEYLYRIVSGSVRTYKVLSDGRRQIGAFYLPGDLFGLEFGQEHAFSAEAISETKVLVIKRSTLVTLAAQDHDIAYTLFTVTGCELQRVQDHMLVLIKSAQERVVDFLLEMANRLVHRQRHRTSDVAAGHRRLSRPDDRDSVAYVYVSGRRVCDRTAKFPSHSAAQSNAAEQAQQLGPTDPIRETFRVLPCESRLWLPTCRHPRDQGSKRPTT